MREWAFAHSVARDDRIRHLALAFLVSITSMGAIARNNHRERGWLGFPPRSGCVGGRVVGVRMRRDGLPFALTTFFVICAYLTLAVMMFPT
jgi:hypothetical protein